MQTTNHTAYCSHLSYGILHWSKSWWNKLINC